MTCILIENNGSHEFGSTETTILVSSTKTERKCKGVTNLYVAKFYIFILFSPKYNSEISFRAHTHKKVI
jgi:hypothetical protein